MLARMAVHVGSGRFRDLLRSTQIPLIAVVVIVIVIVVVHPQGRRPLLLQIGPRLGGRGIGRGSSHRVLADAAVAIAGTGGPAGLGVGATLEHDGGLVQFHALDAGELVAVDPILMLRVGAVLQVTASPGAADLAGVGVADVAAAATGGVVGVQAGLAAASIAAGITTAAILFLIGGAGEGGAAGAFGGAVAGLGGTGLGAAAGALQRRSVGGLFI